MVLGAVVLGKKPVGFGPVAEERQAPLIHEHHVQLRPRNDFQKLASKSSCCTDHQFSRILSRAASFSWRISENFIGIF